VAVDEIDLKIPRGITGFVGPNGAGKTTTINIILGLLKPDSGQALVFGLDSWAQSTEIRQKLGVLHEEAVFPKSFTGQRFLEHVAQFYDVQQPKQRARELLSKVGLSEAGKKPIKGYSAGMLRRLGLAQALVGDPEFVVLDEPTANIDPSGRLAVLETVKQLNESRGTSFFVSSHILSELEKICSWLAIINRGKIVDQGSVEDLATKYSANIYRIEVSDAAVFLNRINKTEFTEKAWIDGDKVYCKVKDTNSFHREMPRIVADLGLMLKSFQYLHSTLEEIYKEASVAG
jgi:ABC-2 type transport system ATP-binding protein